MNRTTRTIFAIAVALTSSLSFTGTVRSEEQGITLYDPSPAHLWNRLHRALFVRTMKDGREFGHDLLDPLHWTETRRLIDGSDHDRVAKLLEEFNAGGHALVPDPFSRAIVSRDLWAFFDIVSDSQLVSAKVGEAPVRSPADTAALARLRQLFAVALRKIALSPAEIAALPDNYARAVASKALPSSFDPRMPDAVFLPPKLLSSDGDWIELVMRGQGPAARHHLRAFGGRSLFRIFLRHPRGKDAGKAFREALNRSHSKAAPAAPRIEPGTQLALVRQMILVDDEGRLRATKVTLSVELRVIRDRLTRIEIEALRGKYSGVSGERNQEFLLEKSEQRFFEVHASRRSLLFERDGGLKPTKRGDQFFFPIQPFHFDPFEDGSKTETLDRFLTFAPETSCVGCHDQPGNDSFRAFTNPALSENEVALFREGDYDKVVEQAFLWKYRRFEWGVLETLWQTAK